MRHPFARSAGTCRGLLRSAPALLGLATVAAVGCADPARDFDSYVARAPHDGGSDDTEVPSQYEDVTGRWLLHALLAGGLDLGLRLALTMDATKTPSPLHARIWLLTSDPSKDPPLVETDSTVARDGTFRLVAAPLVIPEGALPSLKGGVSATVYLDAATLSASALCGTASGSVDKPLTLDLAGSTFGARRDDGTLALADVPRACHPSSSGGSDAGAPIAPPTPPDLSSVPSHLADLTGDFYLDAKLAGSVPLALWAHLSFIPALAPATGGSLDGALRRASDPPGVAALATFSTTVDRDGRFTVWIPTLTVGSTSASVLLVAATESQDAFCGEGAGHVARPIMLDLHGTTFGAVRWTPGAAAPSDAQTKCP